MSSAELTGRWPVLVSAIRLSRGTRPSGRAAITAKQSAKSLVNDDLTFRRRATWPRLGQAVVQRLMWADLMATGSVGLPRIPGPRAPPISRKIARQARANGISPQVATPRPIPMHFPLDQLLLVSALCCVTVGQSPKAYDAALTVSTTGAYEAVGGAGVRRFDGSGATLRLPGTGDARTTKTAPVSLSLRLTDWGRGDQHIAVGTHAAIANGTDAVHYVHGTVTERYQLTPLGFEQSFVIAERPPGNGDLVLGVAADAGGLRAPACPPAVQELQFRGHNGEGICYGAAIAFGRGSQRQPIATSYDGRGRIELIVPGALLDHATYPVIVDPVVGPIFSPSGAASSDTEPDVAYGSHTGRSMSVWRREIAGVGQIRARIYEEDGTPATGVFQVSSPLWNNFDCGAPCVVSYSALATDWFAVFFESDEHIGYRFFDADGISSINGLAAIGAFGNVCRRPSASSMGDAGLILAWDRTLAGDPQPSSIEARGIVGWSFSGINVVDAPASGWVRNVKLPKSLAAVSISGNEWLVTRAVWERLTPVGSSGLVPDVWTGCFGFAPLNVPLLWLDPPSRIVGVPSAHGDELPAIGMVASKGEDPTDERFLIAYQTVNGDVVGRVYDFDGHYGPSFGALIDIATTNDWETEPVVVGGACQFSVGYRSIGANQTLRVRAYRSDGTELTTTPATLRSGPNNYLDLQGGSRHLRRNGENPSNRAVFVWQDIAQPTGASWDIQARFYEPVAGSLSPFGSGCVGPTGTTPQIAAHGDPTPGNQTFGMTLSAAPANSLAVLLISDQLTTSAIPGAPGCSLYAGVPVVLVMPTVTNATGNGSATVPLPCNMPPGVTLAFQWGVYTPGHNAFGWIVSNDMDVSWSL